MKKDQGDISFNFNEGIINIYDKYFSFYNLYFKDYDYFWRNTYDTEYDYYEVDSYIYNIEIYKINLGKLNFTNLFINKKVYHIRNIYRKGNYTYYKDLNIKLNVSIIINPLIIKIKNKEKYINWNNLFQFDDVFRIYVKSLTNKYDYNFDLKSKLFWNKSTGIIFIINIILFLIYIFLNFNDNDKFIDFIINYFFSIFFLSIINDIYLNKRNDSLYTFYLLILYLIISTVIIIIQFNFLKFVLKVLIK